MKRCVELLENNRVGDRVDKAEFRWFGRVERMDDCRMAKSVLMAEVT